MIDRWITILTCFLVFVLSVYTQCFSVIQIRFYKVVNWLNLKILQHPQYFWNVLPAMLTGICVHISRNSVFRNNSRGIDRWVFILTCLLVLVLPAYSWQNSSMLTRMWFQQKIHRLAELYKRKKLKKVESYKIEICASIQLRVLSYHFLPSGNPDECLLQWFIFKLCFQRSKGRWCEIMCVELHAISEL